MHLQIRRASFPPFPFNFNTNDEIHGGGGMKEKKSLASLYNEHLESRSRVREDSRLKFLSSAFPPFFTPSESRFRCSRTNWLEGSQSSS